MDILVAEDEVRLAETIAQLLREQKYHVDVVHRGDEALEYARLGQYDLLLLDVMLPGQDGFQVARTLRAGHSSIPILMLTARGDISDKVHGLDCGADDYMTKPFAPEELLARVRALTRRQGEVTLDEMSFHDLTLQLSLYDLRRGEKSVCLSPKEFEVMRLLMANPGYTVPKETLITKVWGSQSEAEDNNVEAYISFLRKKLSFLGSAVGVVTQRKVGYRLEVKEG